jgi:hypothetical protein
MNKKQVAQIEQDIIERFEPNYSMSDYDLYAFPQIWPSIDGGFGFVEQDATAAMMTYVFIAHDNHIAYVYFDNKFAYTANPKNRNFKKDLEKEEMAFVIDSAKYQK